MRRYRPVPSPAEKMLFALWLSHPAQNRKPSLRFGVPGGFAPPGLKAAMLPSLLIFSPITVSLGVALTSGLEALRRFLTGFRALRTKGRIWFASTGVAFWARSDTE